MMTSNAVRNHFLSFFSGKGHSLVHSAPITVKDDPTLLFTNAGMNQFKDFFLGNRQPFTTRIADTQKCLRVSGKHNDLEEVGVDTYHHTMFEMLGNWSFGDYFKPEAIAWSWELLTEVYKIPKENLYVTIFEGDEKERLPKDLEAFEEWKKWISEDRILLGKKKDNFWEMGDTGPCGPCTEIHVDCRTTEEKSKTDGKTLVNNDHPQVIEIWNIVFIQYNRLKDGSLQQLPARHVDTGMGFERLVRVIQGKFSNYDTDVFTDTIALIEKLTGKHYDFGDSKQAVAFRVLADHLRAISFTIADGQLPSNNGAGYVIRRILRRAVRYYYTYLGCEKPLLHLLVPALAEQFATVFPELKEQASFVGKVIHEEEEAFLRTVEKGLAMLNEAKEDIGGAEAFKLYDTYGFPLDLTKLIASEKGLRVDEKGFEAEMLQQKTRSKAAAVVETDDWTELIPATVSRFIGYEKLDAETTVSKYRRVTSKGKEGYQLVLTETPFYAESGGQAGDKGTLNFGGDIIVVTDTKKENNLTVHYTEALPKDIKVSVKAHVDANLRLATTIHHSATHLLHAALRQVLGTHVAQKGSLVNGEHLRFDFSHFGKVTDEELCAIETTVNDKIRENFPVIIKEMDKDEALKLGAMALFGEKYGDRVRVVIMDPEYSVELCGGTHVGSTGQLGLFRIKHETAVAAGVRRIEAVSGLAAEELAKAETQTLASLKLLLKNPKDLTKAVADLLAENNALRKKIEGYEALQLNLLRKELLEQVEPIEELQFLGAQVEVGNPDSLKKLCLSMKADLTDFLVILVANIEGKPQVCIMIDETLNASKGLDAQKIIKEIVAPKIKGGGGGQKLLATAGGQDAGRLREVIEQVKDLMW